jgi:tetratricopeptide (TPR) repeat protein
MKRIKAQAVLVFYIFILAIAAKTNAQKSDSAAMWITKGDTFYSQGQYDDAVECFNKAIDARPDLAASYLHRGYARRSQGDLNRAIEDYSKAEQLDPKSVTKNRQVAEAFANRGLIDFNAMDMAQAIADYNKAINIMPDALHSYIGRGEARLFLDDFKGALEDFNHVIAATDEPWEYRRAIAIADRGYMFLIQGDFASSARDMAEARRMVGKDAAGINYHITEMDRMLGLFRAQKSTPTKATKDS